MRQGAPPPWVLIAAGLVLAYVFTRGGNRIPVQVIPLDEPSQIQWAETDGVMALQH